MKTSKLKVGLYVNDPDANILKFIRCFRNWNMDFVSIWRDDLKNLRPGDVDTLLLHGGWYGINRKPGMEQYSFEKSPTNDVMASAVRKFVRAGGGAVGVCCGAYNVIWLDLIEADMSRMMGVGMHSLEAVNDTHPIVKGVLERATGRKDRKWKALPIIRVSGPILFPKHKNQLIMAYDWERRLGAIVAAPYGKGRAVAMSPHPEATENELDRTLLQDPPMRASLLLRNSLYWSAGWQTPKI